MLITPSIIRSRVKRRWARIMAGLLMLAVIIGCIELFRVSTLHNDDWGLRFMNYDGYWTAIEVGLLIIGGLITTYGVARLPLDWRDVVSAKKMLSMMSQAEIKNMLTKQQRLQEKNLPTDFIAFMKLRPWTLRLGLTFAIALPMFMIGAKLNKRWVPDIVVMVIFGVMVISGIATILNAIFIVPSEWATVRNKQVQQDELILVRKHILHDLAGALSTPSAPLDAAGALSSVDVDSKGGLEDVSGQR